MSLDVVTIGSLNVDLLINGSAPTEIDDLRTWVGPANVTLTAAGSNGYATLAFAKLGLRTGVVALLADDVLGNVLLQEMIEAGVDVKRLASHHNSLSGIGIYLLLFGSQKRPMTYRYPTHPPWPNPLTQADYDYLLSARHIHCAGYLHYQEMWNDDLARLYRLAQERGLTTSFDPQSMLIPYDGSWLEPIREIVKYTDVLLVDDHEAARLTMTEDSDTAATILQQGGPRVVVIKEGARGTLVRSRERSFQQPGVTVPEEEIVDTVGAGDVFDAAFITAFLHGRSLERCARYASLAAASTLRGAGGISSLASREELERQLENA